MGRSSGIPGYVLSDLEKLKNMPNLFSSSCVSRFISMELVLMQ